MKKIIDELINLEKHSPLWREYFVCEQERLKETLQLDSNAIEHIGSTAIANICAKPIVDIMVGVDTFPPSQYLTDELMNIGYDELGNAGVPNRLYFRYRQKQSFNVHVVKRNGQHWKSNLAFRDYLKVYSEEAKRYENIKIKAVESGVSSLLRYSKEKSAIIEELVSRGLAWKTANSKVGKI